MKTIKDNNNQTDNKQEEDLMTRKDSIKKMGKYAALTAMGTFMLLNPRKAQANSQPPEPGAWN